MKDLVKGNQMKHLTDKRLTEACQRSTGNSLFQVR